MAFSAAAESSILALIFNATAWANVADNAAASPLTNFYAALHSADPTGGTQASSEAVYTSYTREAVARSTGGFTIAANVATFAAAVNFPAGTSGTDTISYFSLGTASSGATAITCSGTVTPNITTGSGITPQLTAATSITLS